MFQPPLRAAPHKDVVVGVTGTGPSHVPSPWPVHPRRVMGTMHSVASLQGGGWEEEDGPRQARAAQGKGHRRS